MAQMIFLTRDKEAFANHCHALGKLILLVTYCVLLQGARPGLVPVLVLPPLAFAIWRRIPVRSYLSQGALFIIIAILMAVAVYEETGDTQAALYEALRFTALVLASLLLLDCTHADDLASALSQLLYPIFRRYSFLAGSIVQLTLSMLPLVMETAQGVREARLARGERMLRHPIRSTSALAASILMTLLDRIEHWADALSARLYDPYARRPWQHFSWRDIVIALIICAMLVALPWTR